MQWNAPQSLTPVPLWRLSSSPKPSNPISFTNFTSSTFVNPLAKTNANLSSYISSLHSDPARRANAAAVGYPANFFIVNPSLRGGASLYQNGEYTRYDSMQVEFRRRMSKGLLVQANYVLAKDFSSSRLSFRRTRANDLGDTAPHAFKINWVYELPIGTGRTLFANSHGLLDRMIGGWNFQGAARIQSGDLQDFGNVKLVGMTYADLKNAYALRFDDANRNIFVVPQDIIDNTIRAFKTSTSIMSPTPAAALPGGR